MKSTGSRKTIIIVSANDDYSAKLVAEWVFHYASLCSMNFRWVNTSRDHITLRKIQLTNLGTELSFSINDERKEYQISDISGIFFRSGSIGLKNVLYKRGNSGDLFNVKSRLNNYFMAYHANLKGLFLRLLNEQNQIGFDNGCFINKLDVLHIARQTGLSIPTSIIATTRKEIEAFKELNGDCIIKSLGLNFGVAFEHEECSFIQYTEDLTPKDLSTFPDVFSPTLVQKKIDKLFEIRVFFLKGMFFSSALFSQNNPETVTDYRHYNQEKPTRVVPFSLPNEIEERIKQLMSALQLKTGSLDIIFSTQHEYIFLEVNPGGQYGGNSDRCNYHLDQEIAKQLFI